MHRGKCWCPKCFKSGKGSTGCNCGVKKVSLGTKIRAPKMDCSKSKLKEFVEYLGYENNITLLNLRASMHLPMFDYFERYKKQNEPVYPFTNQRQETIYCLNVSTRTIINIPPSVKSLDLSKVKAGKTYFMVQTLRSYSKFTVEIPKFYKIKKIRYSKYENEILEYKKGLETFKCYENVELFETLIEAQVYTYLVNTKVIHHLENNIDKLDKDDLKNFQNVFGYLPILKDYNKVLRGSLIKTAPELLF